MKSWNLRERARETLSKEVGYVTKPHGDRLRVALAFPNTYWVGMSNLGFQTIYRLFNAEDDIVCERFFLPPKQELAELVASNTRIVTLESQTPVSEFDVIAFSVSFEWDYTNVLTLLRLAGVPRWATERTERDPLVVIGGAVTFVNPEPLAPFADVIAAGEGEALVPALRRGFSAASDRHDLLQRLSQERGFYIPSLYEPHYGADGTLAGYRHSPGVPFPVQKAALRTTEAVDPSHDRLGVSPRTLSPRIWPTSCSGLRYGWTPSTAPTWLLLMTARRRSSHSPRLVICQAWRCGSSLIPDSVRAGED